MSSIDTRIVDMQFNNGQFNAGVKATVEALNQLKKGLKMEEVSSNVDSINKKLSLFGAVGFASVNKLVDWAANAGGKIVSNLISPITEGGLKRSLNLEQAYFQLRGLVSSEEEVAAVMANVNQAVDGTAYGLDAAAVAASQLAASGYRAGTTMQDALSGISGVAAMAGSSYEDIASVFTKVAGQGRLMGDDLLRLSARGVNAASTLANEFNLTEQEVREMVTEGQISFEMFAQAMNAAFGEHATKANDTYAGSLSNVKAALARLGQQYQYGTELGKSYGNLERQRKVFVALIPLINAFGAGLGKVMDKFNELAMIKTDKLVEWMKGLGSPDELKEKMIPIGEDFAAMMQNIYDAIHSFAEPIREAFESVFDISGGFALHDTILKITGALKNFTEALILTENGQNVVRTSAAAFFQVLNIGRNVLKLVWEGLKLVGSALRTFVTTVWESTGPVRELFTTFLESIFGVEGKLSALNDGLEDVVNGGFQVLIEKVRAASEAINEFVNTKVGPFLSEMSSKLMPAIEWVRNFEISWSDVGDALTRAWEFIKNVYETIKPYVVTLWEFISSTFGAIRDFLSNLGLDNILKIIAAGGLIALVKSFMDTNSALSNAFKGISGIFDALKERIESLTEGSKATKLFLLAAAILALSVALLVLSSIDPLSLAKGLSSLAGMLGIMVLGLEAISAVLKTMKAREILAISASLGFMALALIAMAGAIKIMASLDFLEVAEGLAYISATLFIMTKALNAIRYESVLKAASAFLVLALGLYALAGAILLYSLIPWNRLFDGLSKISVSLYALMIPLKMLSEMKRKVLRSAVALNLLVFAIGALAAVLVFMSLIPFPIILNGMINLGIAIFLMGRAVKSLAGADKKLFKVTLALIPLATALLIMSFALIALSAIPFWEMISGMVAFFGILAGMSMAMSFLGKIDKGGKKLIKTSLTLVVVAGSMLLAAIALKMLSAIPFDTMVKGLLSMGVILALFVGSIYFLSKSGGKLTKAIPTLLIVASLAALLYVIVDVLTRLGAIDWESMKHSLIGLGITVGVLVASVAILGNLPKNSGIIGAAALIIGAGGFWLIAEALIKLGEVDWDTIQENLGTMAAALGILAAGSIVGVLGLLGGPGLLLAAEGLKALAEAMQAWAGVTIPEGIGLGLGEIALGILAFTPAVIGALGALISGFALQELAAGLSSLQGVEVPENFISSMGDISAGIMLFTPTILGAIGTLVSGAGLKALAEGLSAWKDAEVPDDIGEQLGKLAQGIGQFGLGNVMDALGALASGAALKSLAEAVVTWNDIELNPVIEEQLTGIATGIGAFNDTIMGAISALITGSSLGDMAEAVHAWDDVTFNPVIEEQLTGIATGIGAFNDTILGAISASIADGALYNMADAVKNWEDVELNTDIQPQLESLAAGVGAFNWQFLGGGNMANAVEPLGDLAGAMRKWEGVTVPDTIEDDLKALAKGVGEFSFMWGADSNFANVVEPLSKLPTSLSNLSDISVPADIDEQLGRLAAGVKEIATVNGENLDSTADALQNLSSALQGWRWWYISDNVVTDLSALGDAINDFTNLKIDTSFATEVESISTAIDGFTTAVTNSSTNLSVSALLFSSGMFMMKTSTDGVGASLTTAGEEIAEGVEAINTAIDGVGTDTGSAFTAMASSITSSSGSITIALSILSLNIRLSMVQLSLSVATHSRTIVTNFETFATDVQTHLTTLTTNIQTAERNIVTALGKIATGARTAINSATTSISTSIRTMISTISSTLRGAESTMSSGGAAVGSAIMRGIATGINSNRSVAINAASSAARSALQAAKNALDIHSPSRKFAELGSFIPAGLAMGILANEKVAEKAAVSLSSSVLSRTIRMADELDDLLSSGLIEDPVITPVLDLSLVKRQTRQMSGILNTSATRGIAMGASSDYDTNMEMVAVAKALRDNEKPEESITFNQYNSSPKALSSADIYRQTKNQLSKVKKGLP